MYELVTDYGYLGLFVAILVIPVPGEPFLALAGYLVYLGRLSLALALTVTVLGSCLGVTGGYVLGRLYGHRLLGRYGPRLGLTPEKVARARQGFQHVGGLSLTAAFFLPQMRDVMAFVAGTIRVTYPWFALFAYLGGLIWPSTFIALGYYAGEGWEDTSAAAHRVAVVVASLLTAALIAWVFLAWRRHRGRAQNNRRA